MTKWLSVLLLVAMALASGCRVQATQKDSPTKSDATLADCSTSPTHAENGTGYISVFFTCATDPVPSTPRAVQREAPLNAGPVEAALKELLKGPTRGEKENGFSSFFSSETDGMLNRVTISGQALAIVDFSDFRDKMNNASTSAGAGQLMGQLNKTVFQFDEIQEVEYRFDGSCEVFFQWLQSECTVISGSDYR